MTHDSKFKVDDKKLYRSPITLYREYKEGKLTLPEEVVTWLELIVDHGYELTIGMSGVTTMKYYP